MHKKFTSSLWFCILVVCLLGTSNNAFAQQRTADEARTIADKFITAAPRKSFSQFSSVSFAGLQKMQTASEILQTGMMTSESFFVFSNEDSQPGFVIVSGDERMSEVLGYSFTDTFDADNLPDALVDLLKQYQKEWQYLQTAPMDQQTTKINTNVQRRIGQTGGVSPLLQTKWNQSTPYNNKCPKVNGESTVTGCVATAAAQVMKLYEHPATGTGSVSYTTSSNKISVTYDFSSKEFDWANMLNSYSNGYTTEQADAVAELMAACGAMCKMDYGTGGSATSTYNMMTGAVEYMNYDVDAAMFMHDYTTEANWQQTLVDELDAGHPLIFSGVTDNNEGHCFIADGYKSDTEYPSFHINWGWGGLADGYYKTTSLRPEAAGIGGVADTFKNSLSVILGFQPENNVVDMDSHWQGESLTISPATGKANQENTVTCTLKYLFNYANKTFDGVWNLYLDDEDGNSTQIEIFELGTVQPLYGIGEYSFDLTIPSLPEGKYTLRLASSDSSSDAESDICFGSGNPEYLVTESGTDPDNPTCETDLQVTDLSVEESATDGSLTMTLTQIANFADLTFEGDIKMAIASEKDDVLTTFGDATTITSLESYHYMNNPRVLTATWPECTLPDGHYHFGAAANQTGYENWTMLKKWSLSSDNKIASMDEEACIDCWVEDGKFTLSEPAPKLVTEIQLSDTTLTINALEKYTLTATVLPENAANKSITWKSSNKKVATVYNGIVTAVLGGECVITATAADGSGVKAECKVTVVNPVSNINYYVDNELYQTVQCEYSQEIVPIDEPEKEGFTFGGWKDVPQLMPAHDIDIYGEFERNIYSITYMYEESVVNSQNLYFDEEIPAYEYKPEDTEHLTYTFLGWLLDGQDFTLTKMPARDLTLVANVSCYDGIDSVGEGETDMTVSTPSGIVVKTDATKADLQKLPRGIYIIKTSKGVSKVRL